MRRRLDEWIFGNLLESIAPHAIPAGSMFRTSRTATSQRPRIVEDGLTLSPASVKVIELPVSSTAEPEFSGIAEAVESATATLPIESIEAAPARAGQLDWLSQPLSRRGLAWSVDVLAVLAALLLFALVFLSVTGGPPRWPTAMSVGAAVFVASFYWGFFKMFGGGESPGARLARLAGYDSELGGEAEGARFR
jgi:hypothetical protein